MHLLSLRPDNSLSSFLMNLSIGFDIFVTSYIAIRAIELLIFTLKGLFPFEHMSDFSGHTLRT